MNTNYKAIGIVGVSFIINLWVMLLLYTPIKTDADNLFKVQKLLSSLSYIFHNTEVIITDDYNAFNCTKDDKDLSKLIESTKIVNTILHTSETTKCYKDFNYCVDLTSLYEKAEIYLNDLESKRNLSR